MWYKDKFFKYSTAIVLLLLIVFLLGQVDFILAPIMGGLMVIAFPLIVTLLFYYLLRPLVRILMKHKLPKVPSILVSFLVPVGGLTLLGILVGSTIVSEFNQLISREFPRVVNMVEKRVTDMMVSGDLDFLATENMIEKVTSFIEKTAPALGVGIFSSISSVTSVVTALLLVPFILFYFLKDDSMASNRFIKLFPLEYQDETEKILSDIDKTLSSFITGQAMVSVVIGVLMYIGYLIIGLKYALVLALFALLTAMIPFFGPILGVIPALFIGFSYNISMILKILIVMVIVQQLEGNLITPQIMGKRIHTHPVTIILVILLAASLFGFVGILLAIPTYAVLKVFVQNALEIYRMIRRENSDKKFN
ncbi:AI-2E family transporter [Alkaliphilus hydrothermalis]|uniref:PurR-regulated permease PerM n=1 Tax=Alkaliphilus hydrothermalis TaxID=1482730 RepID=A0ABS2NLR7_9FIRM|nr:AI-2E family transporter [Alkaliphilus hydrothermalis]MBM7613882.1 putative PurR-regulated permease PerM [Alkaliphilus hydrothermalis]